MRIVVLTAALLMTAPAFASSDDAWAEYYGKVTDACLKASAFKDAKAHTAVMDFDDSVGYSALVVEGVYPQEHMQGAKGMVLCLYNKTTETAVVTEMMHAE